MTQNLIPKSVEFRTGERIVLRVEPDEAHNLGTISRMWDDRCVAVKWDDPERVKCVFNVDELVHTHHLIHHKKPERRSFHRVLPK